MSGSSGRESTDHSAKKRQEEEEQAEGGGKEQYSELVGRLQGAEPLQQSQPVQVNREATEARMPSLVFPSVKIGMMPLLFAGFRSFR